MKFWSKIMFLHTIVLFATMTFAQSVDFFGIEDKTAFNGTVKWVQFDSQIGIDLAKNTAEWFVYGYNSDFQLLVKKQVIVSYSGQAITVNAQKNAAASELNLTYNGQEQ